ncbi:dUTP diphosphatase [Leptospira ryugenii]|uniref:dUTP diphosphatase n=1 Tax=Leptospira ryugenii TaxID=1917863 RepID=UPI001AE55645|nr:dUTP diphosphatase [Leptospira ryugenii]
MEIGIKALRAGITPPEKKTEGACGFDLASATRGDLLLPLGKVVLVPTGIALSIPMGYEGEVRPRSGFSTKNRILMPNAPGTIDSDYRGEIFIPLLNLGDEDFVLTSGTRIAQILFKRVETAHFVWKENLDETTRGDLGFGSTG